MSVIITHSSLFDKSLKRLAKRYKSIKYDLIKIVEELQAHPNLGTKLGRKLRKVRMPITSKGKGKSGGARIITYEFEYRENGIIEIKLLYIYDKSERSSLTDKELKTLVEMYGL